MNKSMAMALCWCLVNTALWAKSPILGYDNPKVSAKKSFQFVLLKYARTHEVLPMLRNICRECDWVVDHARQSVGLMINSMGWATYKNALLTMDKRRALVRLDVSVIEVNNTQSERYRQLLSHLSTPIAMSDTIDGMIELMVSSGNASLVSSPRVIGTSGAQIQLKVGDQMPYKTAIQSGTNIQTSVQYIHTGIELNITPFLHYDDRIDLDIELHYSAVNGVEQDGGVDMPIIASRTSTLSLQITQNATVVFAGLLDHSTHESLEKVPFIGDLPFIGGLFQRSVRKNQTTDLIYKITPTAIR